MNPVKIATLSILLTATSCAVTPRVAYKNIDVATDIGPDQFDSYFMQGSKIRVEKSDAAPNYSILSIPKESSKKVGLVHADSAWQTTNITITKMQNTDLVSEIGSSVTDHRVDYINDIGSVLKTVAPILAGYAITTALDADVDLPFEIDLVELLADPNVEKASTFQINKPGISILVSNIPPDAEAYADVFGRGRFESRDYFYAACREVNIDAKIKDSSGDHHITFSGKIADANYVQRVQLPVKGKITAHSQCGVSVSSDTDTGVSTNSAVVNALVACND